ncbi:Chromaffin granule amine transporter, partial [Armadillidium nasatum]
IPVSTTIGQLITPMAGLGFAIGMVDSSMMPELGYLGPAIAGSLVQGVGFKWMLYSMGFINFLYAPLMYFLKNPPPKTDEHQICELQGRGYSGRRPS